MNTRNSISDQRADIVECGRRLYHKGHVASNDGNLSVRLSHSRFLVTPAGKSKGFLRPDDLVIVDDAGSVVDGHCRASSEIQMHLAIYAERRDVNAIVHAHPAYATGFATAGQALNNCVLAEIVATLGSIPLAPYATPSTLELPQVVVPLVRNADAILLENHGVVTCGTDIYDAYFKMERVEHYAHILYIARMLGGERLLSREDVRKLEAIRPTYGTQEVHRHGCVTCEGDCIGPECSLYEKRTQQDDLSDLIGRVIHEIRKQA